MDIQQPDILGSFIGGMNAGRQRQSQQALSTLVPQALSGDASAIPRIAQYDPNAAIEIGKYVAGQSAQRDAVMKDFVTTGVHSLAAVANNPDQFYQTLQGLVQNPLFKQTGIDPSQITPDKVLQLQAQMGVTPVQPQTGFAPAGSTPYSRDATGAVTYGGTMPERSTSRDISAVNPNDFTPASLSKYKISGNYTDLVPMTKQTSESKSQLVDVVLPDGSIQKQWVVPGQSTGTPVGAPKASPNAVIGGREAQFIQRVINAAELGTKAVSNVMELPVGASSGLFGVGASPGHSLLGSAKGVLTNKMASQDVQDLNTMMVGLGRNLAGIETQGLAPQGAFTESFNQLQMREGDTNYTKLRKLAEMRQIIEYGLGPLLDNPRVPGEQKKGIQRIITNITTAVPFTQSDITTLQRKQETNPSYTFNDLAKDQGLSSGAAGGNDLAAAAAAELARRKASGPQ